MADIEELSAAEEEFLEPFLPRSLTRSDGLPVVTLTYASSLDGMISLSPGVRTTLSGPGTKSMTHYLRLHHDAILIGAGTAVADDPALNCRYPGATLDTQPQPIVLDPSARWETRGKKLLQLASQGKGKVPLIICKQAAAAPSRGDGSHTEKRLILRGNRLIEASEANTEYSGPHEDAVSFGWQSLLEALKAKGINSVMVEGGAKVIKSMLTTPCLALVDSVIITIAPTWLGEGGVAIAPAPKRGAGGERNNVARLRSTTWRQFGDDAVLCGHPLG